MGHWWRPSLAVVSGWLLVLAGAGAIAVMWLSSDPVDTAQIIGTVVALVVMVAGGCAVLWRWSRAGLADRRSAANRLVPGARRGRLPKLGKVELTSLGVRVPRTASRTSRDQLPYASRHALDPRLRTALQESRFVLVHGPSACGKSHSTAEAARAVYGDRPVLVPAVRPDALSELLDKRVVGAGTVVWLDDVDRHIGAGLDAAVVQRLLAVDDVVVVATIRAAAYEQLKPQGELRPPGRDVVELAVAHRGLVEFTGWDAIDREQAAQQYVEQSDVVSALEKGMGLGEYLAAGPELVERMETGAPPAEGVAVVRAAADWYRAGLSRPAPLHLVRQLYPLYLPPDDALLLDRFDRGLQWAGESVSGARLITHRTDGSGLAVHDYYLDHVWRESPREIPSKTFDAIRAELADSPEDLSAVGVTLMNAGVLGKAERWFRLAADAGDLVAMNNLGVFWYSRGDLAQAERWYRPAAVKGYFHATFNLGAVLARQGELVEAERWTRVAANAGHPDGMALHGALLYKRGELVEAERWYRAAAETGHRDAMTVVGALEHERGELAEAERWFRAAADAGDTGAMNDLAVILADRGDAEEAERWYRAAAKVGAPLAMFNLGVMMEEQGDLVEAERWYRWAADGGDTEARDSLEDLLYRRRDGDAES